MDEMLTIAPADQLTRCQMEAVLDAIRYTLETIPEDGPTPGRLRVAKRKLSRTLAQESLLRTGKRQSEDFFQKRIDAARAAKSRQKWSRS